MESIWEVLKIEKTSDQRAIKRAYAALAGKYNPEEYPEEFLRIRKAYESALACAKEGAEGRELSGLTEVSDTKAFEENAATKEPEEAEPEFRWNFAGEDPYEKHPAVLKFRELYTGKRRKDHTAWMDYFVSEEFLDVWREEGFASRILEVVKEQTEICPPGKEFLTELYLTYGISCQRMQLYLENHAAFQGVERIMDIAMMGPAITRFKGNDAAIGAGFRDYRELLSLAAKNDWNDENLLRIARIIDGYMLGHISDRPIQNYSFQYDVSQRHPKSLKLLNYFFSHTSLPDQVYRLLWNHLHLESAVNGKNKLFYGNLRDTVLVRVPEVAAKPKVDYRALNKEYAQYVFYFSHHKEAASDPEGEARARADIDAFFAREEVQCALMDERYVEGQVLRYWITRRSDAYAIRHLEEFFRVHGDAPYRDQALEYIEEYKVQKRIETEYKEDEASEPVRGYFDFQKRPYVRHYLNTAFHMACGVRNSVLLSEYLSRRFPYCAVWAQKLTDPERGGLSPEHPAQISFGENVLQIVFHRKYLEYRWNDAPVGPVFPWENLKEIPDDPGFWLLLPITWAPFEAYEEVYEELTARLSRLPLCREDIPVIADCICGTVCRFAEDENTLPVFSLYREKDEQLYGCDIYNQGTLVLYEETPYEKKTLPNGQYYAGDMDTALSMAQRLLEELTAVCPATASISLMPGRIFKTDQWWKKETLEEEVITQEVLQELLDQYFDGKLNRLELAWGVKRSLVFLKDKNQYACLYFEHGLFNWYGLVSLPEVYATVDSKDVMYRPFGLGMLPDYLIHQNLNLMKSKLNEILAQVGSSPYKPQTMMWAPKVCRFDTRLQYHLAMRLYGGYTEEQARNQLLDKFYIQVMPECIRYIDPEGNDSGTISVTKNKMAVQDALSRYMSGKLLKLTLTWKTEGTDSEGAPSTWRRHIILLQDQGRYQMIYLDEQKRKMEYLVWNVREYMDAEGKKYRKEVFRGKTVPGYLVHEDLTRIRDCLDLLIPQILYPDRIVGQFGEFAYAGEEFEEGRKLI